MVEEMKCKRSNITIGACPIVHRIKIWKEKKYAACCAKRREGTKKKMKKRKILSKGDLRCDVIEVVQPT